MKNQYFELTKEARKETYLKLKETSYFKQFVGNFAVAVIFGFLSIVVFLFAECLGTEDNFLYFYLLIGFVSFLFTSLVLSCLFTQDKEELMYHYYKEKCNKEEN